MRCLLITGTILFACNYFLFAGLVLERVHKKEEKFFLAISLFTLMFMTIAFINLWNKIP